MKILNYILNRLKEPSTYAGLALLVGMFGLDQDTIQRITANLPAIATGIGAIVAIVVPSGMSQDTVVKDNRNA